MGPDGETAFTLQLNLEALGPGMYSMEMTTTKGADTVSVRRSVRVTG
jgi:hypothetical protein